MKLKAKKTLTLNAIAGVTVGVTAGEITAGNSAEFLGESSPPGTPFF